MNPIKQRIMDALTKRSMSYRELMEAVFPPDRYPNAWNYSSNGGPPGCAMAFGRALRELGLGRRDGRYSIHQIAALNEKSK